jgi:hypothetical protein
MRNYTYEEIKQAWTEMKYHTMVDSLAMLGFELVPILNRMEKKIIGASTTDRGFQGKIAYQICVLIKNKRLEETGASLVNIQRIYRKEEFAIEHFSNGKYDAIKLDDKVKFWYTVVDYLLQNQHKFIGEVSP